MPSAKFVGALGPFTPQRSSWPAPGRHVAMRSFLRRPPDSALPAGALRARLPADLDRGAACSLGTPAAPAWRPALDG